MASQMIPDTETILARLDVLEARVAALETGRQSEPDAGSVCGDEECRAQTCSYYGLYLAQGPGEYTHREYHAVERQCLAAQDELITWLQAHEGENEPEPRYLIQKVRRLEQLVRA